MTTTLRGAHAARALEAYQERAAATAADHARKQAERSELISRKATGAAVEILGDGNAVVIADPERNTAQVMAYGITFTYDLRGDRLHAPAPCGHCHAETTYPLRDIADLGAWATGEIDVLCERCLPPHEPDVGWRARIANSPKEVEHILNELGEAGGEPWTIIGDPMIGWTIVARISGPHDDPQPDVEGYEW